MLLLIPVELLRGETQAIFRQHAHAGTELPEMQLVIIVSRVALYICLDMKVLIELLKEEALVKGPARWVLDLIDIPPLSDDTVLDDTGVGDERVHAKRCHHRSGVAVADGGCRVLHCLLTRDERRHKKS